MTAVVVTILAMDAAQKMESSVTGGPVPSTLRVPLLSEWITFPPLSIAWREAAWKGRGFCL